MPVAGGATNVPVCALRPEGSPGVQTTLAAGPDQAGHLGAGQDDRLDAAARRRLGDVLAGRVATATIGARVLETRLRITSSGQSRHHSEATAEQRPGRRLGHGRELDIVEHDGRLPLDRMSRIARGRTASSRYEYRAKLIGPTYCY